MKNFHFLKVWKKDLLNVLLLGLSVCIYFWPVFLHPDQMLAFYDDIYVVYPWKLFAETMINEGQLPLWLSYSGGGEPFIANMQPALFYPPNILLFSIFPAYFAISLGYILHTFLAGFFMYLLTRYLKLDRISSFLSSIMYMYSGFFITITVAGEYAQVSAACWIPLIFLLFHIAIKQKSMFYGLLTGIPLGFQILAGHMQITLYTLFSCGLSFVFRSLFVLKETKNFKEVAIMFIITTLMVVVGLLLAAIQFLPTFEFSRLSTRAGVSYDFATSFSFPRLKLVLFVLPNFFGNFDNYWGWGYEYYEEYAIYIGILPLIMIFFALFFRKSKKEERAFLWFLVGLAILSMLISLGRNTPFYYWLWKYIPGFNIFRTPAKIRVLCVFAASLLAGFGFNSLTGEFTLNERNKVLKTVSWAFLLLFIFLLVCGLFLINYFEIELNSLFSIFEWNLNIVLDLLILGALSLGILALIALRISNNPFNFKYLKTSFNVLKKHYNVIVVLFVLLNLWIYHFGFFTTKNTNELYPDPDYIDFLQNNAIGYRIYDIHDLRLHYPYHYTRDGGIPENSHIIYGINKLDSDNPLKSETYEEVYDRIHLLSNNLNHPILSLLNVKYVLTSSPLEKSGFDLIFSNETMLFQRKYQTTIYENKQVLPKVFVVHNIELLSQDQILQELERDDFNPLDAVLLEKGRNEIPFIDNGFVDSVDPAEIKYTSPNEMIVTTNITQPGFLVLSENYYPGWNVYVDGVQQTLFKAYYTLQAVYLDAGLHEVRFTFEPISFRIGAWITCLTSLFLVGTISLKQRRLLWDQWLKRLLRMRK